MPRTGASLRRFPSDTDRLSGLRRRAAASENVDTLRRAISAALEIVWTAPELRGEIDGFVARINEKIERLAALRPKRPHTGQPNGSVAGTTIRMVIGPWRVDARGVRSRVIWNANDGPVPPPLVVPA
jgi:hypothetical protein